ncbi:MAG: hypothetical protein JWM73_2550, partial [Solirubrobacterales bacterium]|nr:hypothetical protein [Solirubrobacterales bacterium]
KVNLTSDVPEQVTLTGCDAPGTGGGGPGAATGAKACVKRTVVLKLARRIGGRRVTSARVRVAGRRARVVHGRRARVSFRGVKARRAKVRVVYRLAGGREVVRVKRYSTCSAA